ncbi:MAG: bifunctional metallophosphatase/5'-nucleotidase [Acidimicrobiia bacterium]|nr:bifunctional metallophosphatase/5'-nucleotidase [Acidimicrobiia bacterium]MYC45727.1 bifunctional metallophosphatase/5'-nucleotidase [Acidimicrobiia bacterium]
MTQKRLPTRGKNHRINWRKPAVVLAALGLLVSVTALAPTALNAQDNAAYTLTILHNNDGESKLLHNPDRGFPGIARFVTAMRALQEGATTDGVLTVTAGDNFLASKEWNVSLERGAPFYDSIGLSGLYDAMAVGNHDMDFGPDVAAEFFGGFDPPVVFLSANLDVSAEPALVAMVEAGRLARSTIVETGGDRVGVIGAITPMLGAISAPRNAVVSAVAEAVNAEVASLTEAGVNKIVLISHLQQVAEDVEALASISGVDVAIGGGSDAMLRSDTSTCLPEEETYGPYPEEATDADGNTVPVVTAPGGYRCIGELVVSFDADGNVVSAAGRSVGVSLDETPDPDVLASVEEPLAAAVAALDSNILATTEVDLDGRRSQVRTRETNQGNLVADASLWVGTQRAEEYGTATPDIAIQGGGGIRNDSIIPAGSDLSESTTFDISPFNNVMVTFEMTRERLKEAMEVSYDCIPGTCGQYSQVAGMSLVIDIGMPGREIDRESDDCALVGHEGARVRSIVLDDGTVIVEDGEVVPGDPVVMTTVSWFAGGGDCFPAADLPHTKLGINDQRTLADYLTDALGGVVTAEQYPAGGEGRVTILDSSADEMDDGEMDDDMGPPAEQPTG